MGGQIRYTHSHRDRKRKKKKGGIRKRKGPVKQRYHNTVGWTGYYNHEKPQKKKTEQDI